MSIQRADQDNYWQSLEGWIDAGLPRPVAEFAIQFQVSHRYRQRVQRFVDYYYGNSERDGVSLQKAWRTIEESARSVDALLTLFMVLPEIPDSKPFQAI